MRIFERIKRSLGWHIYWNIAIHLPPSFKRCGKFAKWMRATCCRQFLSHVGKEVNIENGAEFSSLDVIIGDYSGIGIRCHLYGAVTLGNHVMMGPDCDIHSGSHRFDRTDIPMEQQGFVDTEPVVIGNDVWIGSRVTILPAVKIGDGAIVGAASVVTKDVPPYAIAVGNPAVVKKYRK